MSLIVFSDSLHIDSSTFVFAGAWHVHRLCSCLDRELVLEDFFRVVTRARMEAHYMIEQIVELCIAYSFVSREVEAFLED